MRRISTVMASAGAAALTTLAVTVAVPALGDDGGSQDPTPNALATCLRAHGLDGAPSGDALKPWLGRLLDNGDATAQDALAACSPQGPDSTAKPAGGVAGRAGEEQLRSCLKDHGVDAPPEATMDLKRWIFSHRDEAATTVALKACGVAFDAQPAGGECPKPVPGDPGTPGDKPDTAPAPAGTGTGGVTTGT